MKEQKRILSWLIRLTFLTLFVGWVIGCSGVPCQSDRDCLGEQSCVVGVCQDGCAIESDCSTGQTCIAEKCRQACADAQDCIGGEVCSGGGCVAAPQGQETAGEPAPDSAEVPQPDKAPDTPECQQKSDCPSGKICQDGRCLQSGPGCQPECKIGEVRCAGGQQQRCEKKGGCGKWGQGVGCGAGSVCQAGVCAKSCSQNSDCPTKEHCKGGVCSACQDLCQPNATKCAGEKEVRCRANNGCGEWEKQGRACPTGQLCKGNACASGCTRDSSCPSGKVCDGGFCVAGCRSDSECNAYKCIRRKCATSCSSNDACQTSQGYLCQNNACTKPKSCQKDADCPGNYACKSGTCRTSCQANSDCQQSFLCINKKCAAPPKIGEGGQCNAAGSQCASGLVCIDFSKGAGEKRCLRACNTITGSLCPSTSTLRYTCRYSRGAPHRPKSHLPTQGCFTRCTLDSECQRFFGKHAYCSGTRKVCVSQQPPGGKDKKDYEICSATTECAAGYTCRNVRASPNFAKRCMKTCKVGSDCKTGWSCSFAEGGSRSGGPKSCFLRCSKRDPASTCRTKVGDFTFCSSVTGACISETDPKDGIFDRGRYFSCVSRSRCGRASTCERADKTGTATRCMQTCESANSCGFTVEWKCLYKGGTTTGSGSKFCYNRCKKDSDCFERYSGELKCSNGVCVQP